MSTVISVVVIIAIVYILGSILIAQIVMRLFRKQDPRKVGTGSVTSTAVMIHGSTVTGSISLLGEIVETFLVHGNTMQYVPRNEFQFQERI